MMDQQVRGGKYDSYESLTFSNSEEADIFFGKMKEVFLQINLWGELFGEGTEFQLCDVEGSKKLGLPSVGESVKIKIPGPKSIIGEGSDWVKITDIKIDKSAEEEYMLAVSPTNKPGSQVTAHFFKSDAKNYFIIRRDGATVFAEAHGRNEIPNLKEVPFIDKIRNFLVAYKGILGFSKIHWKLWCENILDNKHLDKCLGK